jgi:UDP-N-acetylmuramate--alanine ligase
VIGGKVDALGGNAKLGQSQWVVVEADESDGSFLHLPATYGAITNIDNDHLDHFESLENIEKAFVDFVTKVPFYGKVAVCLDDPGVQRILSRLHKPFITYGTHSDSEFQICELKLLPFGARFQVRAFGKNLGLFELEVPGQHNVLNAVAAISLAFEIGVPVEKIQEGIKAFGGVKRRFEVKWKSPSEKTWIIDDYGHHPTEVRATLAAGKNFWHEGREKNKEENREENRRVVVLFQPHRYTRTQNSFSEFLGAFQDADRVLLTDIYPAGEAPIPGISSAELTKSIPMGKAEFGGSLQESVDQIVKTTEAGDLIICMGAGSITRAPQMIQEQLAKRKDL